VGVKVKNIVPSVQVKEYEGAATAVMAGGKFRNVLIQL